MLTAGGVLCHARHEGHASEDRFGNCQEGEVSQSAALLTESESEVFIDPKNIFIIQCSTNYLFLSYEIIVH